MHSIFSAIRRVLSDRRYLAGSIVLSAAIFSIIFFIQVKTVPDNSGAFLVDIFGWSDWFILAMISVINALFITIEIYIYNLKRSSALSNGMLAGLAAGGSGTLSGILASVFSTATCGFCVSAIFGFLGANGVLFLVRSREYVVAATLFLLFTSLYLSSKRFDTVCQQCRID